MIPAVANEKSPNVEFGSRVRSLRLAKAMTQKELADKIGVDFTYTSKIEAGLVPPEERVLKLAEVLGVKADELLQLAKMVPGDIKQVLTDRPGMPEVLRTVGALSDEQVRQLLDELKERKTGRE